MLSARGLRPDCITVDPPRKGLSPQAVEAILSMASKRIVYVSCDPGTLARDLKQFCTRGYAPTAGTAVDMFPHTPHVETVVSLSRK
jgi:23S rRNA (uracil1939-C5)-methyltransferase